ncbi:MAG: DUF3987 domain-containing protein [Phycisphaerales bacterium]|nr:DUF3987 domain-containing protein [Phycisphaerales bacterium]
MIGDQYRESGLLARLLLTMPVPMPKRWTEAEIHPHFEKRIEEIIDRLCGLQFSYDDEGNPVPFVLKLSPDGKESWERFYNEHAQEQIELTGDLAAAWSKLEGYAARLALIIHFIRWADDDPTLHDPEVIDSKSISVGVILARWFGSEAKRIYGVFEESDEAREQRRFIELIQRKGGWVSVRDWQRTRHITSEESEQELLALVTAGYGRLEWTEQTGRGQPTKRFFLSYDTGDGDTNSPGAIKNGNSVTVAPVTDEKHEAESEYRGDW